MLPFCQFFYFYFQVLYFSQQYLNYLLMNPQKCQPETYCKEQNIQKSEDWAQLKIRQAHQAAKLVVNFLPTIRIINQFQTYSLIQHQQVIMETLSSALYNVQFVSDTLLKFTHQPKYDRLTMDYTQYFFKDLVAHFLFNTDELSEFKSLILGRSGWQYYCIELTRHNQNAFHVQLAYLFYIALKVMLEVQTTTRLTEEQVVQLMEKHVDTYKSFYKQKMVLLNYLEDFEESLLKILVSMAFALNGIFKNRYRVYNQKVQKYLKSSIKVPEKENKKTRTIRRQSRKKCD